FRRPAEESSEAGSSLRYLPRRVDVDNLEFSAARRQWFLAIENAQVDASLQTLENFAARLTAANAQLRWRTEAGTDSAQGAFDIVARGAAGSFTAQGQIDIPETILLPFQAAAAAEGERPFTFAAHNVELHKAFWPALLSDYFDL